MTSRLAVPPPSPQPGAADGEPDGLPPGLRGLAVLTVSLAVLMAVMDSAIANIALPTIARDVGASAADSIWVVNAYQLAITMCLLPFSSLGEVHGYRRIYQAGLAVFTLGSLACALSGTLPGLTLARVFQGVGAAGIMSVNTALTRFIWPRALLGRGLGINAMVAAVSSALWPTVAAGILSVASWEWLFAVNVPLGLFALVVAARSLPATPRSPHRYDGISAVLSATAFGTFILSVDALGHGTRLPVAVLGLAATAGTGVLLVRRQLRLPSPLLPVDLLRNPLFSLSIATSVCSFMAQMLAYVVLPFYLQGALGRDAVGTGLLMTPWPVMVAIVAPLAGRLADRYPAGVLGGIGLGIFAAGLVLLAGLPLDATDPGIAWRMAVCGLGFGLFQSPNNRAIMNAAPRRRSGGASGMLSTARLLGQALGAASTALVFSLYPAGGVAVGLLAAAACAAGAAGLSCLRLLDTGKPAD